MSEQRHFNHFKSRRIGKASRCLGGNRILSGWLFCDDCLMRLPDELRGEYIASSQAFVHRTDRPLLDCLHEMEKAIAAAREWLKNNPVNPVSKS